MSIENHPNFHSVKFVTDITKSFIESTRGKALGLTMNDNISKLIFEFVEKVETEVDNEVNK